MKTLVDERLLDEAERFRLRHSCEDCAHFDGARCGDAWPTEEHRLPVVNGSFIVFCKQFESS